MIVKHMLNWSMCIKWDLVDRLSGFPWSLKVLLFFFEFFKACEVTEKKQRTYLNHFLWVLECVLYMISYFRGLTLTVSIYSSSTCLIILVLITLFNRRGTTKHLSLKHHLHCPSPASSANECDFIIRNIYKDILTFVSIRIIYSCFNLFTFSSTLLLLYFVL